MDLTDLGSQGVESKSPDTGISSLSLQPSHHQAGSGNMLIQDIEFHSSAKVEMCGAVDVPCAHYSLLSKFRQL